VGLSCVAFFNDLLDGIDSLRYCFRGVLYDGLALYPEFGQSRFSCLPVRLLG
jgi:hypothetical protein